MPAADPASWWGTRAPSRAEHPLRDPARAVPVSASLLDSLAACPARWFFEREAGGASATHQAAGVGQVVHALAERVGRGDVAADVTDPAQADAVLEELMDSVDRIWGRLSFRTPWSSALERERVRVALARFVRWHAAGTRRLVGLEAPFDVEVVLDDGRRIRLHGYADRLEVDDRGRLVVVDLKTGKNKPTKNEVVTHAQLALYQYAVDEGALAERLDDEVAAAAPAGGAELVHLGLREESATATVQRQEAHLPGSTGREALRARLGRPRRCCSEEAFPATPGPVCRGCTFVPICPARSAGSVVAS